MLRLPASDLLGNLSALFEVFWPMRYNSPTSSQGCVLDSRPRKDQTVHILTCHRVLENRTGLADCAPGKSWESILYAASSLLDFRLVRFFLASLPFFSLLEFETLP